MPRNNKNQEKTLQMRVDLEALLRIGLIRLKKTFCPKRPNRKKEKTAVIVDKKV
jgi:hypothetical protein